MKTFEGWLKPSETLPGGWLFHRWYFHLGQHPEWIVSGYRILGFSFEEKIPFVHYSLGE